MQWKSMKKHYFCKLSWPPWGSKYKKTNEKSRSFNAFMAPLRLEIWKNHLKIIEKSVEIQ